jgi:hypothetical protein
MTDRDEEFKKAQASYSKRRETAAWQKMFELVYNCCRAICLSHNYRQREDLEDLVSNATLICMEKIRKAPDVPIKSLSAWCYYPCFEQLAGRMDKRRHTCPMSYVDNLLEMRTEKLCEGKNTNKSMNIQSVAKMLGKNGCLLFCDLMLMGLNPALALADYEDYVREGIIEPDCYVKDHDKLLAFYGKKGRYVRVKNRPVTGLYIACFKNGDVTHFVLRNADDNDSIYDPLGQSNTVVKGIEVQEWRIIR